MWRFRWPRLFNRDRPRLLFAKGAGGSGCRVEPSLATALTVTKPDGTSPPVKAVHRASRIMPLIIPTDVLARLAAISLIQLEALRDVAVLLKETYGDGCPQAVPLSLMTIANHIMEQQQIYQIILEECNVPKAH